MTGAPRLVDLADCFEGVIPSIIATSSADGMPNISYLSHVARIDDRHVALSNQFFGKTAGNLAANPQASVLLVDGATGRQFRLDAVWVRSEAEGPVFDEMAAALRASSAQVGMEEVMRLVGIDIFRVEAIVALPHPDGLAPPPVRASAALPRAADLIARIAGETETEAIVAALLDGTLQMLGCEAAMLLQHDAARGQLVAVASRGYGRSGAGAEIALGVGVPGRAAAARLPVRVADMSRVRRFGAAIRESSRGEEEQTRTIALPGLAAAQSQLAAPMLVKGGLWGVLLAESVERLAFRSEEATALGMVANHAAATLLLGEALAGEAAEPGMAPVAAAAPGRFRVLHHGFDDSVFIDNGYVIRGVAGRLLVYLLERHLSEGRLEFSNREIRVAPDLKLPDFRDNLETRLLLLRNRLEEKAAPVRLRRAGRGVVRLELAGRPVIERSV